MKASLTNLKPMQPIEFETHVENGAIAIPPQYQRALSDRVQVKVTVLPSTSVANAQPSLYELLSRSPLSRLDFEQPRIESPVRVVGL